MKKFFNNQKGQAMVEYGIIVALVALVGMASLQMLGDNLSGAFQSANQTLGSGDVSSKEGSSSFGGISVAHQANNPLAYK